MRRFENGVALVIGSTRGSGAEITRRLASEGASVVVTGTHLTVDGGQSVVM